MRLLAVIILSFLFFNVFVSASYASDQEEKFIKAVVLSRHGARAPTQSRQILESWSQKKWPDWPVKQGELTPRGASLVKAMWRNLGHKFAALKLLPVNICPKPGDIYIRADTDERTRATASAIISGLVPDCQAGYAVLQEKIDPLFHPVKAGLYKFDPIAAATDVLRSAKGGLNALQDEFSGVVNLVGSILGSPAPALCERFALFSECNLANLPNAISITADGANVRLLGALDIASSVAEIFLMEYAQWPGTPAGWGQVNETVLSQILPVHARIFDVINRAPSIAWAKGSGLLVEITNALLNNHVNDDINKAKLVIYVGHDTNIANIGSLLNINWQPRGYAPNEIPPGGALFFELWEIKGKKQIKIRFFSQSPKKLHENFSDENLYSLELEPTGLSVTTPPVVGEVRYDPKAFTDLVKKVTKNAPLPPVSNPPLVFNKPE